jgi:uncharacterized protein YdeI (YjbR/CyaY-like superfamily)
MEGIMPKPDKTRIQAFEDSAAFYQWLVRNHASEPEVWVKIYEKGSGQKSVSWDEAVEIYQTTKRQYN